MEKWDIQAIPRVQNRLANLAIDNQTIPEL
jgi:hypothetical protein